ncbi:uncharacterized protein N7518_001332 [Penicillium psychrosexuale]|uniref:uncharacterized protein n=1 Tax=Penicillium psychrosexuale TaxID=1002107 RepID=UPI0025451D8D|nr:uncharacterized protein N7518_001332 [Penicillium psychrosexuale]KAJ5799264.1 hypothetical protein N7518_001332 [Penicillium psychrosexuale]
MGERRFTVARPVTRARARAWCLELPVTAGQHRRALDPENLVRTRELRNTETIDPAIPKPNPHDGNGDQCLAEDPKEHGPKVVDLLQNMEFPKLDGDAPIDDIIDKCWHNKYATVAALPAHTETLITEGTKQEGTNAESISVTRRHMVIGRIIRGLWCSLGNWRTLVRQILGLAGPSLLPDIAGVLTRQIPLTGFSLSLCSSTFSIKPT